MYLAELKGKLPSKIAKSEDILTSNVFSFLKYSKRSVYLKAFLSLLDIAPTDIELLEADFIFWPSYDDNTEPDVIILVGAYYLLFEAKYFSDFGEETPTQKKQIIREYEGGQTEAENLNKSFTFIAITADYNMPTPKFDEISTDISKNIKWVNWQAVSKILLSHLEQFGTDCPDFAFAQDLYMLLAHKRLRGFLSFNRLEGYYPVNVYPGEIFFNAQTANFRGGFLGFQDVLSSFEILEKYSSRIFYDQGREYFGDYPMIGDVDDDIFFKGDNQ